MQQVRDKSVFKELCVQIKRPSFANFSSESYDNSKKEWMMVVTYKEGRCILLKYMIKLNYGPGYLTICDVQRCGSFVFKIGKFRQEEWPKYGLGVVGST